MEKSDLTLSTFGQHVEDFRFWINAAGRAHRWPEKIMEKFSDLTAEDNDFCIRYWIKVYGNRRSEDGANLREKMCECSWIGCKRQYNV